MKKKKCTGKCKERKSINDFNRDKTTKDGRKSQCRECTSKTRPSRAKVHKVIVAPIRIKSNCMDRWWV